MNPLDDLRRAWAEHRARVAAQDAECARIDRDLDAAHDADSPKVLGCDCDSCRAALALVADRQKPHRQPDYAEQLAFVAERESASRALAEAVAQIRFAASLTSADRDWLTREGVAL